MTLHENIIQQILEVSDKEYPDSEIYLFGSHARGDFKPLSDWDLLILLDQDNITFSLETEIMDRFYDIELKTGQIISPIIYSKKEWNTKYKSTPLYENINAEGIRLK
ncbi:MAG: nucleotidyltransferase domain-containing protein [Cyclobacteriaceae bacterium]|nr:nucleotidyltransferase domain-containing protein [Cyclobacteriaceae bacterium]